MTIELEPVYTVSPDETEMVAIDYTDHLDSDETLSGTPTVTSIGAHTVTVSNVGLNSTAKTILGRSVVANKAVTFRITSLVAECDYAIKISVGTSSSPARTIVRQINVQCR